MGGKHLLYLDQIVIGLPLEIVRRHGLFMQELDDRSREDHVVIVFGGTGEQIVLPPDRNQLFHPDVGRKARAVGGGHRAEVDALHAVQPQKEFRVLRDQAVFRLRPNARLDLGHRLGLDGGDRRVILLQLPLHLPRGMQQARADAQQQ